LCVENQLRGKLPGDAQLTADSGLEELGLTSLDVTEVYFAIEELVGTELDPTAAADVRTIGDLVTVVNDLVAQGGGEPATPSPALEPRA
jgi:acyl carrier protein